MMEEQLLELIPGQYTGEEIIAKHSVRVANGDEAKKLYATVKKRLFDVNNWHNLAGLFSAVFQLVNTEGTEVDRPAATGDFLRIDIPGPGSSYGDGFDWVRIEGLTEKEEYEEEVAAFTVRPTHNPMGDQDLIAHFYSAESTSSFIAMRSGNAITTMILDRNVKPNTVADTLTDKIRHTSVGITAIGGFSKIQWQNLVQGLLKFS